MTLTLLLALFLLALYRSPREKYSSQIRAGLGGCGVRVVRVLNGPSVWSVVLARVRRALKSAARFRVSVTEYDRGGAA